MQGSRFYAGVYPTDAYQTGDTHRSPLSSAVPSVMYRFGVDDGLRDGAEFSFVCHRAWLAGNDQRLLRANSKAPRFVTESGSSVAAATACARSGATCLPTR